MLFIFSIVSGFLFYISLKRDIASPLTVFLLVWTAICFFYGIGLFGIYDVDIITEATVILGVLFFVLGYSFMNRIKIKDSSGTEDLADSCQTGSFMLIKIAILIDYIYMIPVYYNKAMLVIQLGWSIGSVKSLLDIGNDMFTLYIFDPFNFFLVPLTVYCFLYNRKQKFIIFSGIILNGFTVYTTGSRSRIVFFILSFLVMTFTENKEIFKKLKKKAFRIVWVLGIMIILISGYGFNLFRSLYFYLCGCIPLLDGLITRSDYHFTNGFTYGALSLNGFLRIIPKYFENYVNSSLKFPSFDLAEKYIEYFEYAKYIAPGEISNSFYTFIGNFYLDFGYWGIIFLSIIYGAIISYIYKKNLGKLNLYSKVILSFIYYAVFFSMVRCSWMSIRFAIAFLFVIIFGVLSKLSRKFVLETRNRRKI